MQLEGYGDTCLDYVTLYDGPTASSSVLNELCTGVTTITSSSSSVLVVFQSDSWINTGGFSLSWTFNGGGWNTGGSNPAPGESVSGILM